MRGTLAVTLDVATVFVCFGRFRCSSSIISWFLSDQPHAYKSCEQKTRVSFLFHEPRAAMADGITPNVTIEQLATELSTAALINYGALLIMAVIPIWIGSFFSLAGAKPVRELAILFNYYYYYHRIITLIRFACICRPKR